jgi:argininosuccinate lyase
MKMWTGRFTEPADATFDRWQRSFPYDRRLLHDEIAASRAYAEGLRAAGVLDDAELHTMLAGLSRVDAAGVPADDDPTIEDVHHYVERRLVEEIGETGYKLHTGRSRNEQIATDLRLYVRAHCDRLDAAVRDLTAAVLDRAEAAGGAVMPAYTHLRRAEPVLVAHWWTAYAEMLLRDLDRLHDVRRRVNECPLGVGAVAGSVVALDREAVARRLGFDRPTANSIDATSDRDFVIEFVQTAATLSLHLGRLAEDLILFASHEFGFVRLAQAYSTGSSAMPQKQNPDALELTRAHAGVMIGHVVALLTCVKGLPLAYNKDLQETQRPLFDAAERSLSAVSVMAGVVRSLVYDETRMEAAARRGGTSALAAAACLARRGVPFRRAHERVANAVRLALSRGCELAQLQDADWSECGIDVPADELRAAMDLSAVIELHDVHGGTARSRVTRAIGHARERLSRARGAVGVGP